MPHQVDSYTLAAAFWTRNHVGPLIKTHLCTTKNEEGKDLRKMSLLPSNCSKNSHCLNLSYIYKEDDFQGICSLCYLRLIVLCNSAASKITSMYHVWESQIIHSKRQFTYDQNVRPIQGLCQHPEGKKNLPCDMKLSFLDSTPRIRKFFPVMSPTSTQRNT